jgi:hypothetical protein
MKEAVSSHRRCMVHKVVLALQESVKLDMAPWPITLIRREELLRLPPAVRAAGAAISSFVHEFQDIDYLGNR